MSAAKLRPDRRHVGRTQLEELLAVELTQPRRQSLLADESQGEGGHGIALSAVGSVTVLLWMIAQLSDQCSIPGTGRKPAWMLGLRRKSTNLHEKYDYPVGSSAC